MRRPRIRLSRSKSSADLQTMQAALAEVQERLARAARVQQQLTQNVAAILRMVTIANTDLYPESLTTRRFRLASQNEEDGVTFALLQEIGPLLRRFVEIGAGNNGGNSGFLATELGFDGMMVDGSAGKLGVLRSLLPPDGRVKLVSTWITAENINQLVADSGFAGEVDVFSLDIDGNDYWVWKELSACDPRIVIVEYNSIFGPDRSVTIPYDPQFTVTRDGPFKRSYYYGASLRALTQLGATKGYRLVAVEPQGVNAFFLRTDLAPHVPAIDPRVAFRVNRKLRILVDNDFDVWQAMEEKQRSVVDVSQTA